MGQGFGKNDYEKLKMQPELVAGLDLEFVNTHLFCFMLNDLGNYNELHEKMQMFMSMSDERLILTAKSKNISLKTLISNTNDNKYRVALLSKINDYGLLRSEYYNAYPMQIVRVIIDFIVANRRAYDFQELLRSKFDFRNFSHASILDICKKIKFDNEYLDRPEDTLIEQFGPQISSMYTYIKKNNKLPVRIIFKMLEGYYKKSERLVQTFGDTKVRHVTYDYPTVPYINDCDLQEIVDLLSEEYSWSIEDCLVYLRRPIIEKNMLVDKRLIDVSIDMTDD